MNETKIVTTPNMGINETAATWLPDINAGPLPEWQMKMLARFDSGFYEEIPHETFFALLESGYILDWRTGPHRGKGTPEHLAIENPANPPHYDRQWSAKIGRALGWYQGLDAKCIPRISAIHNRTFHNGKLQFATTAEDIRNVYLNGPDSCMSKDTTQYASSIHPVEVYAGSGDMAVAYFSVNGNGKVSARAVVNMRDRLYARIYGTEIFADVLKAAGFEGDCKALEGCRLSVVRQRDYGNGYVAPYLDGCCQFVERIEDADGTWLVIGHDGMPANRTDGLVMQGRLCPHCDERYDGDFYYVPALDEEVCNDCAESDDFVWAMTNAWDTELTPSEDAIYSDHYGSYCTEDYYNETHCTDYNGDEQLIENCVECFFTGDWVNDDDAINVRLPDGREVFAAPDEERLVYSESYDMHIVAADAVESWVYPE